MYKIKLSILLLASLFIFSCTNKQIDSPNQRYSLAYIGGGFEGLLLKNYLMSGLKSLDMYDPNSNHEIKASISHTSNLFITNIDNTSDREKISTNLSIQINNTLSECRIMIDEFSVSQFFIYAPSNKFLSNEVALSEIKKNNTESAVKRFINKLISIPNKCND